MVPAEEAECPRCGAPLEDTTQIGESREATLQEFIENSHQKLVQSGTSAAELAFGVGCTLGFLVGGLLMVIIFIAITKTWTILAVIFYLDFEFFSCLLPPRQPCQASYYSHIL